MNNSKLFKSAHAMARQVIKSGDSYSATFGLCLKAIREGFSLRRSLSDLIDFLATEGFRFNVWEGAQQTRVYIKGNKNKDMGYICEGTNGIDFGHCSNAWIAQNF